MTLEPDPTTPGPDPAAGGAQGPPAQARPVQGSPVPGRRYRTPRYPVFLLTGALLGLAVGVGLALYGGGDTVTTGAGVLGYFSGFGVVLGLLLGGSVAVVVESLMNRSHRRRR
ncbi:hypothetical protein [Aquipuribacter hungaricus]|uniref:Uncharacterized protein n=1 Tax=Aquipuribacter hungaricus TaxID=545624 RepID=A0ABV7WJE3_9MICO